MIPYASADSRDVDDSSNHRRQQFHHRHHLSHSAGTAAAQTASTPSPTVALPPHPPSHYYDNTRYPQGHHADNPSVAHHSAALHLPPPGPPHFHPRNSSSNANSMNSFRLPAVSTIQIPATPPTHPIHAHASASPTSTVTSPVMLTTPASARPPVVIDASPPPFYTNPSYAQTYHHQGYATYPQRNAPIQVLASPTSAHPSAPASANVVVPLGAAQSQFSATAGAMASPALNAAPPSSSSALSSGRLPFRERDWARDRERDRNTSSSTQQSLFPIPSASSSSSLLPPPASSSTSSGAAVAATTLLSASTSSPGERTARRHSTASIGKPVTFDTGPFAGRCVRAEIVEVQKADLGRKCADPPSASTSSTASHAPPPASSASSSAGGRGDQQQQETRSVRKDRRPLDPPPVVSLQFYEVAEDGSEKPISAEDVEIGGLICQVDLFKVTIPPSANDLTGIPTLSSANSHNQHPQQHLVPPPPLTVPSAPMTMAVPAPYHGPPPQVQPHGYYHQNPVGSGTTLQPLTVPGETSAGEKRKHDGSAHETTMRGSPVSPAVGAGGSYYAFGASSGSDAAASSYAPPPPAHASSTNSTTGPVPPIDTMALPLPSEADKLTRCLFGEYYSHAASILDLSGRAAIYFVFSDLSVKLEGLFRPRYRFFDLFSRCSWSADVPVLAECWGGVFAVYSTKEFPGLKASSELTKHLNRWGIRVNIRETERKRRAPGTGGGGGKRGSEEEEEEDGATVTGANAQAATSSPTAGTGGGGQMVMDAPRRFLEGTAHSQRQRAARSSAGGKGAEKGSRKGAWRRGKQPPLPPPPPAGVNVASASASGSDYVSTSADGAGGTMTLPPMQTHGEYEDMMMMGGPGRGRR